MTKQEREIFADMAALANAYQPVMPERVFRKAKVLQKAQSVLQRPDKRFWWRVFGK